MQSTQQLPSSASLPPTPAVRRQRTGAFVLAGAASAALLTASAAPSPLYPVYQRMWGFSALTLTVIFAVYVFAVMASLLTIGSISDRIGRRPLAIGAMLLLAASMVLFGTAGSVAGLVIARIVQGFAVGAATGAIGAMIIDRQPDAHAGSMVSVAAPSIGMAFGATVAGALVEYAPWPRYLVYVLLGLVYLLLAVLLARLAEERPSPRPGSLARELIPSLGIPSSIRLGFLALLPALCATWALAGLYLSLGTSVVATVLGVRSHAVAGLVLGVFFASGAVGGTLSSRVPERPREALGFATLGVGVLITLVGALLPSMAIYLVGSMLAGAGFGATFRIVVAEIAALAPAADRGRVFAMMYLVSYTAFSVPALIAGLLTGIVGLKTTLVGYVLLDALLVGVAAMITMVRRRSAERRARSEVPAGQD